MFDPTRTFYHGTRVIGLRQLRPSTGGKFGPGIYLTDFEPTAAVYAQRARGNGPPVVYAARVHVSRPFVVRKVDWLRMTERSSPARVQARLKRSGYDSVIGVALNDVEWQLVVFDPDDVQLER